MGYGSWDMGDINQLESLGEFPDNPVGNDRGVRFERDWIVNIERESELEAEKAGLPLEVEGEDFPQAASGKGFREDAAERENLQSGFTLYPCRGKTFYLCAIQSPLPSPHQGLRKNGRHLKVQPRREFGIHPYP